MAATLLKLQTNKSVFIPCVTRWSYLALTYHRIAELAPQINQICDDQGWNKITSEDLDMIKDVLILIEPFKELTNKLQSGEIATLSMVYPAIKFMISNLEVYFKSKIYFIFFSKSIVLLQFETR